MKAYSAHRHIDRLFLVLTLAALFAVGGCQLPPSKRGSAPTRSDRLVQVYPELQSGRFAVIADFEDPAHMELFQLISVSPRAKIVLDKKRGRPESGQGCLKLTTGSPDDTVVIGNDNATHWGLKRDWRDYDLLMMATHSPRRNLHLEVGIGAGAGGDQLAVESSWPLEPGWNVIRLDLGAVGEHIPLDDVRDIRLAVTGATKPVDIYFDDIILTGSREDLFGDSQNQDGNLYVQRVARRWNIGAGGRFELIFANGQIIGWYNLASDPYRLRNLAQGTTLGPIPVVVDSADTPDGGFGALGDMVVARPRILEMNAVRAVVTCDWRFVDEPDQPLDDRPYQRWAYTIYPTGQIYATVECTAVTPTWSAPPLGLAVTFASTPEDELQTHETMTGDSPATAGIPVHAWAKIQWGDAFLMYVLGRPSPSARITEQFDWPRRRTSLVAVADKRDTDIRLWQCHLFLCWADEVSNDESLARAIDYSDPVQISFELGSPVLCDGAGDEDRGFDWGSGCYRIRPEGGRARFTIDAREHPRFSPAFEIIDTANREAWVYINHLVFKNVARNAAGNLIFQLPGVIRDPTLVEVLFRRPQQSGGA